MLQILIRPIIDHLARIPVRNDTVVLLDHRPNCEGLWAAMARSFL